ncbi:MAG TPA: hypothetical protein VI703_10050 [Anaerolineales bacterium]|nr:hypothetical protein [Anaerolineales bacterium]
MPDFQSLPLYIGLAFGPCHPTALTNAEGFDVSGIFLSAMYPPIPMLANYVIELEIPVQ